MSPKTAGRKDIARSTLIVIHGKGEVRGIGSEGGGDLDTVSAAAIGAAWARARGMSREESAIGDDAPRYDYAFLNYNEGLGPLLRHRNADVILPDFPINALAPALRLRRIRSSQQAEAVAAIGALLPRLEAALHAAQYGAAGECREEEKRHLLTAFTLVRRGLDARESAPARLAALALGRVVDLVERGETGVLDEIHALRDETEFSDQASAIEKAFSGFLASDLLERLLDEARRAAPKGGGWTDEKMLLAREIHSFEAIERLRADSVRLYGQLTVYLMEVALRMERLATYRLRFMGDDLLALRRKIRSSLEAARTAVIAILDLIGEVDEGWPAAEMKKVFEGLLFDALPATSEVILRLSIETSGAPVAGAEVSVRRTAGEVRWASAPLLEEITGITDAAGLARFAVDGNATDGTFAARALPAPQELIFPDADRPDEVIIGSGGEEEAADEGEDLPDQGRAACAAVLDGQLDEFARRGNRIVILADHHPYAPETLSLLERRRDRGEIGEIILHVMEGAAGKCGSELLYERLVAGTPADTPGLAALIAMAHHLDLHLPGGPRVELALGLSKLIGSGHSKIEIAERLAGLKTEGDLDAVMTLHGWDDVVAEYDAEIAKSLPRVKETACRLLLGEEADPVYMHACLAPRVAWGSPMPKTAAARDQVLGDTPRYLFVYLYEFGLAVMRASGMEGWRLNDLASDFGGGGHPGAASLHLVRDPAFWRIIRGRIRSSTLPIVLEEMGRRMASWRKIPYRGLEFLAPAISPAEKEAMEAQPLRWIHVDRPEGARRIACVFANPAATVGGVTLGLAHWSAHLKSLGASYAVFLPRGLNDVLLLNLADPDESIDCDAWAKALGAPWEGGVSRSARCSMRLNLSFKWSRWMKKPEHREEILERATEILVATIGLPARVEPASAEAPVTRD